MARGVGLVWHGLEEFRAQLRQVPKACTNEAARIVEGGVNSAFVTISTVYGQHRFTGNLQNGLKILSIKAKGEFTTGLILKSGAPHAWLFDHGTEARFYTGTDKLGRVFKDAPRGKMGSKTPPTHIFEKTIIKTRREITDTLHGLVHRKLTELSRVA